MESDSVNASNSTVSLFTPSIPGLLVYYLLFIAIITPVTVANLFSLIAILLDRTTSVYVRFSLCNIPLSCLIVSAGILLFYFAGVSLIIAGDHSSISEFCRPTVYLISVGGTGQLLFMAVFSINVYVTVNRDRICTALKAKKCFLCFFILSILAVWIVVIIGRIVLFFGEFTESLNSCQLNATGGTVNVIMYILVYGVGGFAVTIIFLILTVCYTKNHAFSHQDSVFKKAMLKLSFFLLISIALNFIGLLLPAILVTSTSEEQESLAAYITFTLAAVLVDLSLVPTPILVIMYFKPVRMRLKALCCWCCNRDKDGGSWLKRFDIHYRSIR